ncbi:MAG: substrate-binding domain-containing protein, partial [Actinobacteria bacterium]|nr:substrate-binding domain-containing protein [Actinomycetota bacterium]
YTFENDTSLEDRYKGYCLGLKKHYLEYDHNLVILEKNLLIDELSISKDSIKSLLKNKATAIITASDFIAIGIIKILKELKIRIPQDISIIGFDDILFSNIIEPPLSTIKLPKKSMGEAAINLLIDLIENKEIKNKIIKLPTKLIIRESTSQI